MNAGQFDLDRQNLARDREIIFRNDTPETEAPFSAYKRTSLAQPTSNRVTATVPGRFDKSRNLPHEDRGAGDATARLNGQSDRNHI